MIVESFLLLQEFRIFSFDLPFKKCSEKKILNVVDITVNATKIVSFVQFGMFGDIPN